jgi:hypothetical protein
VTRMLRLSTLHRTDNGPVQVFLDLIIVPYRIRLERPISDAVE